MAKVGMKVKYDLRLKEVLADIRQNADEVVRAWGTDAAELARRLAPRDTGEFASGIEVKAGDFLSELAGLTVITEGGAGTRGSEEAGRGIGGHLEFGTKRMEARPFMRPAAIIARDNMKEKIFGKGIVKPGTKY
jgi:hypothetical protein